MAKSIRSKWKRKCRAVKRVRYGQKELDRLKKTLGTDEYKQEGDIEMKDVENLVTIITSKKIKQKQKESSAVTIEAEEMETNGNKRIFNPKTMRDQNGTFPVWMNQRHIRKQKGKVLKKKKQKNKSKK